MHLNVLIPLMSRLNCRRVGKEEEVGEEGLGTKRRSRRLAAAVGYKAFNYRGKDFCTVIMFC